MEQKSVRLGDFHLVLNEETGELKVILLGNSTLIIKPNSDNSCTIGQSNAYLSQRLSILDIFKFPFPKEFSILIENISDGDLFKVQQVLLANGYWWLIGDSIKRHSIYTQDNKEVRSGISAISNQGELLAWSHYNENIAKSFPNMVSIHYTEIIRFYNKNKELFDKLSV